ncbi:MAG TPA: hypothetical protein VEP93_08335 [Variovorax sp.]|nr:hypothetical protein [Variovorax sp.]
MRQHVLAALLAAFTLAACSPERGPQADASNGCAVEWKAQAGTSLVASLPTDSGMHGLWNPEAFKAVCDFDAWAHNFVEERDIQRHIAAGAFVPIYVHADGAPLIDLRVGSAQAPAVFDPGTQARVERRSRPYLLVSNGMVGVSGIEYINAYSDEGARFLNLPAGRWVAQVLEVEPQDGLDKQLADKVPNFVVLLNPEPAQRPDYSQDVDTFSQAAQR